MRRSTAICLFTLLGLTSTAQAGIAVDTEGKTLFVSTRDGNSQIYVMNQDGSGQRALTSGPGENTDPAWSPDGRHIAFTSYRDGNAEIYVMNADGSHQKCLTDDPYADTAPTWTKDGRIVFRSMRNHYSNFYVMDANGASLKPLTDTQLDKSAPLLSPDGIRIAFIGIGEKGNSQVYVMPASGGEAKNLTAAVSKNKKYSPAWSSDGKLLAYTELNQHDALNIRVIDADGGNPVKLTDTPRYSNASPIWSPDGKRIAFVSSRDGTIMDLARGDIYVMNADGSGVANLTHDPDEDNYPAWSADGNLILFVSLRDGYAQIYSVRPDGTNEQRVTYNLGSDLRITTRALPVGTGNNMLGSTNLPSASSTH